MNINMQLFTMYRDEINEVADMLDIYLDIARNRTTRSGRTMDLKPEIVAAYFTALVQVHQTPMSLSLIQESLDGIGGDIQRLGDGGTK